MDIIWKKKSQQIGLMRLPHSSAEKEGSGHGCHLVVCNLGGFGTNTVLKLPSRKHNLGTTNA